MLNERWGTCVDCPRDSEGHPHPEMCAFTDRYDHHLNLDSLVAQYKYQRIQDFKDRKTNGQ